MASSYITRWDGLAWAALGPGLNDRVYALAVQGDTLYAAGAFVFLRLFEQLARARATLSLT